MPSSTFLNTPFGGLSAAKFSMGGVTRIFILPFTKLVSATEVLDAFGSVISISGLSLAADAKFQQIDFVEGEGSFTQTLKRSSTQRYYEQVVNFSINAGGADANDKAHQIVLSKSHVVLVERKGGKMFILGLTDGLVPIEQGNNSGAGRDDAAGMSFTLTGGNLGLAPEVIMEEAALEAVLNKVV